MDKELKLSVLVTFCNQKEFIRDALNSIFNQKTDFEYEVLVGLDGEDPESEKIIKEYPVKLFKCDNSNLNTISIEKASINRFNLLKHAGGEYFCFLDGDDFYINNSRFQTLVNILDMNKEVIGYAHSRVIYDNKNGTSSPVKPICKENTIIEVKEYLKKRFYISSNECIFRNIFLGEIPPDFPDRFLNDSTLTAYMFKYGPLYYIPEPMLGYRTNIDSIFNSKDATTKNFYALLAGEINFKVLSAYSKYIFSKYHKTLKKCLLAKRPSEYKLISDFAKENNCIFTYNILNFRNLSLKDKLIFILQLINFLVFNSYPIEYPYVYLSYFAARSNFGDNLNLYIIQRLMGINIQRAEKVQKAGMSAIGSILEGFIWKPFSLKKIFKGKLLKIWGSGFIKEPKHKNKKEEFFKRVQIYALRGEISKKRCEKILGKKLGSIALGDPGLLASMLIDTKNTDKTYSVGIIPHYVDMESEHLKNINIANSKIINIMDNPIKVLKEIAECEVILSSAMHGLIAADALNIPNQWIVLSDKLYGGNYKFKDYYSVYNIEPEPIDLRTGIITEKELEKIKSEYPYKIPRSKVKEIQQGLIEAFPIKKGLQQLSQQAEEQTEDSVLL